MTSEEQVHCENRAVRRMWPAVSKAIELAFRKLLDARAEKSTLPNPTREIKMAINNEFGRIMIDPNTD